ncbi:MAG: 16S rRNA (guanine(966)-N(2))-methyltransferase RsmD [Gammaproteobacteria bacterium]|nr:16S rRNA (guanine(966)-N(2))-methyltransferase RsmD [Gammaproteobacteria bacterium]
MNDYSSNNNFKNQFRIIAGKWRSRKIKFPSNVETLRPTTDRIKETLFNWLQQKIDGAHCLDLFSGSGALALEACSRNAANVLAIDNDSRVTDSISENCQLLDCNNIDVITANAMQWLDQKKTEQYQFDIVFLDPPFGKNLLADCCALLEAGNFLSPGAIVYLESETPLDDITLPDRWQLFKDKKAGRVYFGVCERLIN